MLQKQVVFLIVVLARTFERFALLLFASSSYVVAVQICQHCQSLVLVVRLLLLLCWFDDSQAVVVRGSNACLRWPVRYEGCCYPLTRGTSGTKNGTKTRSSQRPLRPRIAETRGRIPRPLREPQNLWTPEPVFFHLPCFVPALGPSLEQCFRWAFIVPFYLSCTFLFAQLLSSFTYKWMSFAHSFSLLLHSWSFCASTVKEAEECGARMKESFRKTD